MISFSQLEEFRKKKAEGRAKRVASTGQLISADADKYENVSQKYDHVRDGGKTATDTESYGLSIAGEDKAVNSSKSTEIHSSNRTHVSSPVFVDSNFGSYGESVQLANEVPKLNESSGYPEVANGYYHHWKESRELSYKKDTIIETSVGNVTDELDTFNTVKTSSNLDTIINNSSLRSFSNYPPAEDRSSSTVHTSNPVTLLDSSVSISENTEKVYRQNRLGFPSTSANTSGLCKGKVYVEFYELTTYGFVSLCCL